MASDVAREGRAASGRLETPEPQRPRLYARRFLAAYVVLAVAAVAAVLGVVLAVAQAGGSGGSAWSTWSPTGSGLGMADQIASHVGGAYRLSNGSQLADVIAKPPVLGPGRQKIPVGYVAIRGRNGGADSISATASSNSVMYTLCGLGPSCSIASGKPSVARGRLVRREILELALYTFHYDGAIDNVIAFMPPRAPNVPGAVVFLQRADLGSQLSVPLARTLSTRTPGVKTMTPADAVRVDELTGLRAYSFSLTQAQDGNAILILTHLRA